MIITLRVPIDGNVFYNNPSHELIERVFNDPQSYGDQKLMGDIAMYCHPPDDLPYSPESQDGSQLSMFFDHKGKCVIIYSDSLLNGVFITSGGLADREMIVMDNGGSDEKLSEQNLISVEDGYFFAVEFCSEGKIEIDDNWDVL